MKLLKNQIAKAIRIFGFTQKFILNDYSPYRGFIKIIFNIFSPQIHSLRREEKITVDEYDIYLYLKDNIQDLDEKEYKDFLKENFDEILEILLLLDQETDTFNINKEEIEYYDVPIKGHPNR